MSVQLVEAIHPQQQILDTWCDAVAKGVRATLVGVEDLAGISATVRDMKESLPRPKLPSPETETAIQCISDAIAAKASEAKGLAVDRLIWTDAEFAGSPNRFRIDLRNYGVLERPFDVGWCNASLPGFDTESMAVAAVSSKVSKRYSPLKHEFWLLMYAIPHEPVSPGLPAHAVRQRLDNSDHPFTAVWATHPIPTEAPGASANLVWRKPGLPSLGVELLPGPTPEELEGPPGTRIVSIPFKMSSVRIVPSRKTGSTEPPQV